MYVLECPPLSHISYVLKNPGIRLAGLKEERSSAKFLPILACPWVSACEHCPQFEFQSPFTGNYDLSFVYWLEINTQYQYQGSVFKADRELVGNTECNLYIWACLSGTETSDHWCWHLTCLLGIWNVPTDSLTMHLDCTLWAVNLLWTSGVAIRDSRCRAISTDTVGWDQDLTWFDSILVTFWELCLRSEQVGGGSSSMQSGRACS